jgi:hypothetical protein
VVDDDNDHHASTLSLLYCEKTPHPLPSVRIATVREPAANRHATHSPNTLFFFSLTRLKHPFRDLAGRCIAPVEKKNINKNTEKF